MLTLQTIDTLAAAETSYTILSMACHGSTAPTDCLIRSHGRRRQRLALVYGWHPIATVHPAGSTVATGRCHTSRYWDLAGLAVGSGLNERPAATTAAAISGASFNSEPAATPAAVGSRLRTTSGHDWMSSVDES